MKLSPHFDLEEFTVSQTATRLGLVNQPNAAHLQNLIALCTNVLEPIRAQFGPIKISSGYRAPEINRRIGGAKTSQHCKGEAADFLVIGRSVQEIFDWVQQSGLPFDQLIHEFGAWVHVSHSKNNRRQALYAKRVGTKTIYLDA